MFDAPAPEAATYGYDAGATGRFGMGTTSWTGAVQLDYSLGYIEALTIPAIQAYRQPLESIGGIKTQRRRTQSRQSARPTPSRPKDCFQGGRHAVLRFAAPSGTPEPESSPAASGADPHMERAEGPMRRPARRHHALPTGRPSLLRHHRSRRTRTRPHPEPGARTCPARAFQPR